MVQEEDLTYKIVKSDTDHSGISIIGVTDADIVLKFVVEDDIIFQRFMIFKNGLITCEEKSNGQRLFRSNRPLWYYFCIFAKVKLLSSHLANQE